MAKQIKKYGPFVIVVAGVLALVIIPFAQSDPAQDGLPPDEPIPLADAAELSCALREAVGFGPLDVLPATVGDTAHQQIIAAGATFAEAQGASFESLVQSYRDAQDDLLRRIAWNDDPETGYSNLNQARQALVAAGGSFVQSISADFEGDQAGMLSVVTQALELDPELRALLLTESQRESVITAQRERDAVCRNALNWHSRTKLQTARDAFETELQATLTIDQRSALETTRELLADRLGAMATAEAAALDSQ